MSAASEQWTRKYAGSHNNGRLAIRTLCKNPSILLVRNKNKDGWEIPGGEQENLREPLLTTAKRETLEETGLNFFHPSHKPIFTIKRSASEIYVFYFHFWYDNDDGGHAKRMHVFKRRKHKHETSDYGFVVQENGKFVVKNFSQTELKPNHPEVFTPGTWSTLKSLSDAGFFSPV